MYYTHLIPSNFQTFWTTLIWLASSKRSIKYCAFGLFESSIHKMMFRNHRLSQLPIEKMQTMWWTSKQSTIQKIWFSIWIDAFDSFLMEKCPELETLGEESEKISFGQPWPQYSTEMKSIHSHWHSRAHASNIMAFWLQNFLKKERSFLLLNSLFTFLYCN